MIQSHLLHTMFIEDQILIQKKREDSDVKQMHVVEWPWLSKGGEPTILYTKLLTPMDNHFHYFLLVQITKDDYKLLTFSEKTKSTYRAMYQSSFAWKRAIS